MEYEIKFTKYFFHQLKSLNSKTRRILKEKIMILKVNPGRFKPIVGFPENLFRIRFVDSSKSKRLIYSVKGREVFLLCILDKASDYKDLKKYLDKFKDEF